MREDSPASVDEMGLLRSLVAEQSFSGSEGRVARLLREHLEGAGWQAQIDGTGNLIAETGTGPQTLLFLGHIDTVPGWIPVRIEGGALWGRGSVDAKGALAAFIAGAGRAMRDAEGKDGSDALPVKLVLVGAAGEEADSRGTKAILDAYRPDWCVVGEPSGWDGITLGYKGCQTVHLDIRCPRGHGAGPQATAAEAAAELWCALRERLEEGPTARASAGKAAAQIVFASLTCSLAALSTESDGLLDRAAMTLQWRLPPALPPGRLEHLLEETSSWLTGKVAGSTVHLRMRTAIPAFVAPKNNLLVRSFLSAIRERGGRPRFKLKSGTSDMNLAGPAWGCPILAYGPGDSSLDHTPEERLNLAEYGAAIEVWRAVLGADIWVQVGRSVTSNHP